MLSSFLRRERPVIFHKGIFRSQITFLEALGFLSSIGAGILGIPYAISKIGVPLGFVYLLILGLVNMGANLLVGEVVSHTNERLHLPGLARKYLGKGGEFLMSIIFYGMLLGILLVYIIGEGQSLAALFGGSEQVWSIIFFLLGSALLILGFRTAKDVEFILILGVFFVILFISAISSFHVQTSHLAYYNLANLLFPYGVLLFAYHSMHSLPEAYELLGQRKHLFRRAVVVSSLVAMAVYMLFAMAVVGVTGHATTEIATIGLGAAIGPVMLLFGNIFAILAMGTNYLLSGMAFKDSLSWDLKVPGFMATAVVCCVPILLFLSGANVFIKVVDIIGGIFISLEMLLLLAVYWRAKQMGHIPGGKSGLHHTAFIGIVLFFALTIGTIYSVMKVF